MYLLILAMDGNSRAYGERIMKIKRIAALLTLGALLSTTAPALAVIQTGTVNVEWNYVITATLTMYTQTTASQTHTVPAANDIFTQANGGAGQCNSSAGASKDPGVNLNVNFGLVVADGTDYTNCLEINAIDAYMVTNDSLGAALTVQASAGAPTAYDTAANGSLLCILPDGVWNTTGCTHGSHQHPGVDQGHDGFGPQFGRPAQHGPIDAERRPERDPDLHHDDQLRSKRKSALRRGTGQHSAAKGVGICCS